MPLLQLGIELGIELIVVDKTSIVNLIGINADETSWARRIHERTAVVGGSNKRGKALTLFHHLTVWRTELDIVFWDEVLQNWLLIFRHGVKLIDIDERIARHGKEDVIVVLHRQSVVEIHLQIFWQQTTAEGGLTRALRTDEQGYDGITMLTVLAHPLRHHREHPGMEVVFPVLVVRLYPSGQFTYIVVLAVPFWQVTQIILHRIIFGDEIRVDIAVQILIPRFHTCLQRFDSHGVAGSLV